MFILILNPINKQTNLNNQTEKKIEPELLLKALFDPELNKTTKTENILPADINEQALGMKNALTRAMLRAAGQLLTRDMDPDPKTLINYLEQLTGIETNQERETAFQDFFNALRTEKPDVKSNPEKFFEALITTWNKGKFEGLPETGGVRPRIDNDVEELKKKGIEVLNGGVDPISGARITLKIHGKEYTGSYGGVGGVNIGSLQSVDGCPISPDVAKLVEENNQLITRVGMKMANKH